MKKEFCFTIDDNIRFLKEISERGYASIFEHPYLKMLKELHRKHSLAIQLNLFYECEGFNLCQMKNEYRDEWDACADWLRLSFHSRCENVAPYKNAPYGEVFRDCEAVQGEILRFASPRSLARTTTLHYCEATEEGVRALYDSGVRGLLGLYGSEEEPSISYNTSEEDARLLRCGATLERGDMYYAGIDLIVNKLNREQALCRLGTLLGRPLIKVMIHEQYFYPDYERHQPDFEDKLDAVFSYLSSAGYTSTFFEEVMTGEKKKQSY